ncbi:hypothetical protein KFF05_06860 [bacterium SCSIO 12827]|nr:hypothetical protein KFF05_06860 [bacterium SCSIO 12827]
MWEFITSVLSWSGWEGVQGTAATIGALLAIFALIYSVYAFKQTQKFIHYDDIDKNYFEILKIAFDHPYVHSPQTITTAEQSEKYDLYAFMVWNFLEAIHDRCQKNSDLKETWEPIIEQEGARHWDWFDSADNAKQFKKKFQHYAQTILKKELTQSIQAP